MERGALRDLEILAELARSERVTQRGLAARLGIALGLTNLYLKRLARKGCIKITSIPPRRVRYLLTAKGMAEKTRLTYQYMDYSRRLYRETRLALRQTLRPLVEGGRSRVALYGTEEAAELAFLTLRELGLEVAAVFSEERAGTTFLGLPVRPLGDLAPEAGTLVVVASFTPAHDVVARLRARGLAAAQIVTLAPGDGGGRPTLRPVRWPTRVAAGVDRRGTG